MLVQQMRYRQVLSTEKNENYYSKSLLGLETQLRSALPSAKVSRGWKVQDGSCLFRRILDYQSDVRCDTHSLPLSPTVCPVPSLIKFPFGSPSSSAFPLIPSFPMAGKPWPSLGDSYAAFLFSAARICFNDCPFLYKKGKAKANFTQSSPQKC